MAKVNIFQRYMDKYTLSNAVHEDFPLPPFPYDTPDQFQQSVQDDARAIKNLFREMTSITAGDTHSTSELRINQIKIMYPFI